MARKNPADCGTVGPLTDVLRRLRTAPDYARPPSLTTAIIGMAEIPQCVSHRDRGSTPPRSRTIKVFPKDCPSAGWQADRAGICACDLPLKEVHHEAAGDRGAAGLGCRHHRSRALFGSDPRGDASVGIHSGLSASALAPATG